MPFYVHKSDCRDQHQAAHVKVVRSCWVEYSQCEKGLFKCHSEGKTMFFGFLLTVIWSPWAFLDIVKVTRLKGLWSSPSVIIPKPRRSENHGTQLNASLLHICRSALSSCGIPPKPQWSLVRLNIQRRGQSLVPGFFLAQISVGERWRKANLHQCSKVGLFCGLGGGSEKTECLMDTKRGDVCEQQALGIAVKQM